jgi:hypothetical protein
MLSLNETDGSDDLELTIINLINNDYITSSKQVWLSKFFLNLGIDFEKGL